jgi:hypothetical protein
MKKIMFRVACVTLVALVACCVIVVYLVRENERLRRNVHALEHGVEYYRTESGRSAAAVEVLELEVAEYRRRSGDDAKMIESLGIRLRRAESVAKSATVTTLGDTVVLRDTVIVRDTVLMSARHFAGEDAWSRVEGLLFGDSVRYNVHTVDTLHQVVHRVPRRFLFIPYGTRAIRQEVWSSNPNTELVYTEYIELSRRKRER